MAMQTLVADRPAAGGPESSTRRAWPHPAWLGLGSGLLLWLSFPPAEWSISSWFALVPLFLLVGERSARWAYAGSALGGFVFWLLALQWILATDSSAWLGWLAMAGFLALAWPIFLFLARFARSRLKLPLIVAAPVLWVALEYARAHILTGFPWYYLAHSQFRLIYLTQIADFAGSLGLSFLIATVNAFWVDLLTLPLFRNQAKGSTWGRLALPIKARIVVVGVGLLATLGYGAFRVSTATFRPGPRVAMLQSSEVVGINLAQARSREQALAEFEALIRRAFASGPRPDLIVWPETGFPWGYPTIEPGIVEAVFDRQVKAIHLDYIPADWRERRKFVLSYFDDILKKTGVPMMVGASTYQFQQSGYAKFNSAILFRPGLADQVYHKIHLVPFGEYVPLLEAMPWLIRLTPFREGEVHFLDHGTKPTWFDLGPHRLAVAICFEDTVPHLVRRFFSEAPEGRQPDLLVNLSNDGWFHATSEHEMHLAVSVFRCIENRVPLARAVNTGISAMIDGNGRIVRSLPKLKEDVLVEVAPLDDRVSFYSRWGDWLGLSCLAATLGWLVLGTFAPKGTRKKEFADPSSP